MSDLLTATWTDIRQRQDQRRDRDLLRATFDAAQAMSEAQARATLDALRGKPLALPDADLAQMIAQRLGETLTWRHRGLFEDSEWQNGRYRQDSQHD